MTARTKEQQIADCGSVEAAAKYAEQARELLDRYEAGKTSADSTLIELRWTLGHGPVWGIDMDDPFLTVEDKRRMTWVLRAADGGVIDALAEGDEVTA